MGYSERAIDPGGELRSYPPGEFRIRVSGSAETEDNAIKRLNKELSKYMALNHKRVTKINRLRQGIRSLQACHERDQREILNLRQKLAEAGLKITRLERLGLDDDDD